MEGQRSDHGLGVIGMMGGNAAIRNLGNHGHRRAPSQNPAAAASSSIDVMQIMKNAKNLPEEKYDAH